MLKKERKTLFDHTDTLLTDNSEIIDSENIRSKKEHKAAPAI